MEVPCPPYHATKNLLLTNFAQESRLCFGQLIIHNRPGTDGQQPL